MEPLLSTFLESPMLKLLFLSTPVGPLGSGIGGGVELTLLNLGQELSQRGHQVTVVAPQGSKLPHLSCQEISGTCQEMIQNHRRDTPIILPENSVLANMWDYARRVQNDYDLMVNFAFDWLPFYLTPFFHCPIAHFISMGSITDAFDEVMNRVAIKYPKTIGVYTHTQAKTFPFNDICHILGSGLNLSLYNYYDTPDHCLAWVGRIAPEKALEDAIEAAEIVNIPLKIFGKVTDEDYWQTIRQNYPHAPYQYEGFLSTQELQEKLGQCKALLMTPRWVEAFGNVAIEALACGVPVIAYRRGGPAEIVQHKKTGFLVEPDSISGLVDGINQIDEIDRQQCRQQAEADYSLKALGDRFEGWFYQLV
ncbi:glycosyltransferase family 4 protein [Cyanothece sp. BG0011]|uniref:glycosyltransferase family 4 protein n=1 Tax=Cyanothece sp. BG0011 TaxID=2082950 RepID=UPI000D1F376D|nr:glycosyltransferase family 4 protein [Cyanothece sp. BG0011]